jgi:diaminopimelate decarboxylase
MRTALRLDAAEAERLAREYGTPYYLYDLDLLHARAHRVAAAFSGYPTEILYAVKANPNVEVLRSLFGHVAGLDISSGGEQRRAEDAGWSAHAMSFAGPGKTDAELEPAIARGASIGVESAGELERVAAIARALGARARVRLRVNPSARAQAYRVPMIGGPSPFGIDEEELPRAAELLRAHAAAIDYEGLHVHPGGQCTSVGGFAAAVKITLDVARRLHAEHGLAPRVIDLGGGFGVVDGDEARELDVEAAGRRAADALRRYSDDTHTHPRAILELGRWLVAPAGIYVARVVSEKVSRGQYFTILDGGMNHNLAATNHLYGPTAPRPVFENLSRPGAPRTKRTLVGPLCTPLDVLHPDAELATPVVGDLVALRTAGAYGYTFSPILFLGHPPPRELVRGPRELR